MPKAQYNRIQLALQCAILLCLLLATAGTVPPVAVVCLVAVSQVLASYEVYCSFAAGSLSAGLPSLTQVGARIGISGLLFVALSVSPAWMVGVLAAAWAIADGFRYCYYLHKQGGATAWLRYHGFLLLYPLGMTLENVIVWQVMATYMAEPLLFFLPFLAIYALAAMQMYRHMLSQRRRYLDRRRAQQA